jgi:two-component system, NarL family, response regulator NreC
MSIRVLLADDHQIVRQCVRGFLEREGFEVVAEAADGHEAARLAEQFRPDVAVLDVSMPLLNGADASRAIHRVSPRTKTVLLTMHTDDQYVTAALRAGVRGYVVKSQASADLAQAIHDVARGKMYLSPCIAEVIVEAALNKSVDAVDPLTPKERQVLQLIAEGKTRKEIAQVLDISVRTAETHRMRIIEKLDIHQTAGLVRYAIRRGLIAS